jgi:hypothetical protein
MIVARIAGGWAALLAAAVLSFMPLIGHEVELQVHEHHIDHAVLMGLGVIAGLLLYRRKTDASSPVWLLLTVLLPVVIMFLMAPPLYAAVDDMPLVHAFYHVLFVALAALTVYAGQRFVRGVGWMSALLLEFMAFVAAWGYGVAPR